MINQSLTLFVTLTLITAIQFTYAQPPQTYLNLHNNARRTASVPPPPVQWNDSMAATASMIARTCQGTRTSLGINAYLGPRRTGVAGVMALWLRQRVCYIPFAEACIPNCMCRQYRQIVWRGTRLIGCGRWNNCPRGTAMTVCLYWPGASVNEDDGVGYEHFDEISADSSCQCSDDREENIEYEGVEEMEKASEEEELGEASKVEEDEDSEEEEFGEFVNDDQKAWDAEGEAEESGAEEVEALGGLQLN